MAKEIDLITFTQSASEDVIRLVKCGNFYRAYDRSAWLFFSCIREFTVTRHDLKKDNASALLIGFPLNMLNELVGDRKIEATDYGFDIYLSPEELPAPEGYEPWLATVPVKKGKNADYNSLPLAGADAEREVIMRLRDCCLESLSPIEAQAFLADLRKLLSNK